MDARALLVRLAEVIDAHDWEALSGLLHPDFTCRLVHTGEVFDRDTWVRLNADYPGFQRMVVEDVVADGGRAVIRATVTGIGADGSAEGCAVASFATVREDLVVELVEVCPDLDQEAPEGTRPAEG